VDEDEQTQRLTAVHGAVAKGDRAILEYVFDTFSPELVMLPSHADTDALTLAIKL
jgi:hypothetical protein